MNLDQLIETLTDLQAELLANPDRPDVDLPVSVAIQPNYPLAVTLDRITVILDGEGGPRLWLATGAHPGDINPYAPEAAWEGEIVYPPDESDCTGCGGEGCDECCDTGQRDIQESELAARREAGQR